MLALSEVIGLLGKRPLPVLPPWGTGCVAGPLRRLGLRIPDEMLNQLRFGRGLDNRALQGERLRVRLHVTRGGAALAEHLRLHPDPPRGRAGYTYEGEVEEFLRRSPLCGAPKAEAAATSEPLRASELNARAVASASGFRPRLRRAACADAYTQSDGVAPAYQALDWISHGTQELIDR